MAVSGCVISFNEEDRIEACLDSLSFCSEILVLDSASTDRTREIAQAKGARVEIQDFLGHSKQKQRAVELAANDWIFALDCDEQVSPQLRQELEVFLLGGAREAKAFSMPRQNTYLGKKMRHGLFWPDRKLRFFDRSTSRWAGTDPHDRVICEHPELVIELQGPILHDSYRSLAEHRETVDSFAKTAAAALAKQGKRAGVLTPWTHAFMALTKGLLFKHGVLDGWRGVLAACLSARYDYLKYRGLRRLQS